MASLQWRFRRLLTGSSDQFGAMIEQFYSNFETMLRNRLVSRFWQPQEGAGHLEALKTEWAGALNRKDVPTGRDQAEWFPN